MALIFDTHAHYCDRRFDEFPGGADALLSELFSSDVGNIINVAVDTYNSLEVIAQAAKYAGMFAACGIHPTDGMAEPGGPDAAVLRLDGILAGRKRDKIVALGEIGLDYHYADTDRPKQQYLFEEQLKLAEKYDIPVIIHDREAHGDCFDAVIRHPAVRGVFHSYSGSAEMARELACRGWYISFSGTVSFRNAPKVREAVLAVPPDRLLLETDAPYLAPEPYRGKCNRSDYIARSAAVIAALLGTDAEKITEITCENAKKLFLTD